MWEEIGQLEQQACLQVEGGRRSEPKPWPEPVGPSSEFERLERFHRRGDVVVQGYARSNQPPPAVRPNGFVYANSLLAVQLEGTESEPVQGGQMRDWQAQAEPVPPSPGWCWQQMEALTFFLSLFFPFGFSHPSVMFFGLTLFGTSHFA